MQTNATEKGSSSPRIVGEIVENSGRVPLQKRCEDVVSGAARKVTSLEVTGYIAP